LRAPCCRREHDRTLSHRRPIFRFLAGDALYISTKEKIANCLPWCRLRRRPPQRLRANLGRGPRRARAAHWRVGGPIAPCGRSQGGRANEGVHRNREAEARARFAGWPCLFGPSRPERILSLPFARLGGLDRLAFPKCHRREAPAVERTPGGSGTGHPARCLSKFRGIAHRTGWDAASALASCRHAVLHVLDGNGPPGDITPLAHASKLLRLRGTFTPMRLRVHMKFDFTPRGPLRKQALLRANRNALYPLVDQPSVQ
jgi:hypothetical protein